ncbi:unnamed protein product [Sphagnum jensenii]|uniref:Uncharacterized protein n=1 Tax=Sphagnum jensenii TaxID=128206 RepID=A0ABP0WHP2_9BRYO
MATAQLQRSAVVDQNNMHAMSPGTTTAPDYQNLRAISQWIDIRKREAAAAAAADQGIQLEGAGGDSKPVKQQASITGDERSTTDSSKVLNAAEGKKDQPAGEVTSDSVDLQVKNQKAEMLAKARKERVEAEAHAYLQAEIRKIEARAQTAIAKVEKKRLAEEAKALKKKRREEQRAQQVIYNAQIRAEKIITKAKEKALMITAKANEEAEEAIADANIRAERVSSCAIQVHLLSVTPHNKS